MEYVDLINVFDLNSEQELDAIILNALMKGVPHIFRFSH